MIEHPKWSIVKDIACKINSMDPQEHWNTVNNSREILENNYRYRKIFLKSNNPIFPEAMIYLYKDPRSDNMSFNKPIIKNTLLNNGKSSFTREWDVLLNIDISHKIFSSPPEKILEFLYKISQYPIENHPNPEENSDIQEKYSDLEKECLLFLFTQKFLSLHFKEKISENFELITAFDFPSAEQTAELKKFDIQNLEKNLLKEEKDKIRVLITKFFNTLILDKKYSWKYHSSGILYFEKSDWWSRTITKNILQSNTAHQKIKFKKIIEDFFKNQINL